MVIKIDSNEDIAWYKSYTRKVAWHTFDVAPDESRLAFTEDTTNRLYLYILNPSDGSFNVSIYENTFGSPTTMSLAVFSQDSSSFFIAGKRNTEDKYCRWQFGPTMT